MNKTAVITGAGTGVGAATALALGKEGWRVILIGRRREPLEAVAAQLNSALVCPLDIGDAKAVAQLGREIVAQFNHVEVLVNAAGTNIPRRTFELLSMEDYHAMLQTNVNGAYYCTQAFLPGMRARGSGTIVNIVSEAGKQASSKAGPGYVVSKFALAGLTQAINAEEREHGIRACAIFPGDIDTPLLDQRPNPPNAAARARMMQSEDIAACVLLAINLPSRVVIEEMLVRPR
ncbi:MAG: Sepiapterin reductase [Chthoniobacteraceae bacterium]|nr:Sepiapterin reductase [Chthoniobacteraceae bacterium]